ncbi:MAG TPA: hypothetical protein VJW23_07900 [Propionibacteriaceae bacterium]|nr:hypothetical protein [Propionibacteriaceae bacterium]
MPTATLFGISPLVWAGLSFLVCSFASSLLVGKYLYFCGLVDGVSPPTRNRSLRI